MSIDAFPPTGTDTDATLDAIAGLSTSANTMPYFTGVDTAALTPLTPFMRTLLDDPDLATAQATLGITGGGGGAPTDAEYIVGSTNGTLTQERVLTPTPTVSWDLTTPGQAKAVVQDASITEAKLNMSDVTTTNVSTTAHGLTPKLSGVATQYLDGTGAWTVPPAGTTYTDEQAQDAVGAMLTDTATIDLTYGDGGPTLQADVKDSSITEAKLAFVDVATRDASVSAHGLLRKLSGVSTQYLDGSGAWTVPPAGTTYTDEQAQDAVGAMLTNTSTVNLTYVDATPAFSAMVNDASITEAKLSLSDVATKDASTTAHGLLRKLSGTATQYLDGSGAWTTPAGSTNYWTRTTQGSGTLATGLLAFWRLEEASGNRVDSVGSLALVPQGTVAQITNTTGKTGQALKLNATAGTYLSIADNATLSAGTSSFTVGCWVLWDAAPGTSQVGFVGKGNATAVLRLVEYMLYYNGATIRFNVGNGPTSNVDLVYTGLTPVAGTWYFVVGWYDATLDIQYLQVNNGTIVQAANTAGSFDSADTFEVGRQPNWSGSGTLNGRIDNVMFYKRILTAQERDDWWNSGAGQDWPPPAASTFLSPATATDRLVLAATSVTPERLEVDGALKLGTSAGTTDGTLRWSGTDFEGRKAGAWVSMTSGGGQPLDATLTALAGLATGADQLPYATGTDTFAQTPLTAFARTLLDDTTQAAMRTTLALTPGTDVQAQDAELQAIAGLTSAADRVPYFTGSGTAALAPFTAFARTLVDDPDQSTAQVTLGVPPAFLLMGA